MAQIANNNIYSHLSANGSVVQTSAPAILHSVTINTAGVGANVLTILDGAGGTIIAVVNTTLAPITAHYDIATTIGLATSLAGGTVGDVTVSFSRQT